MDVRGGLLSDERRPSSGHRPYALDPERARRLWALSEDRVGERFD